jgi:hypothetical protein
LSFEKAAVASPKVKLRALDAIVKSLRFHLFEPHLCTQVVLEAELRDSRAAAWADAELEFAAARATAEVGWARARGA